MVNRIEGIIKDTDFRNNKITLSLAGIPAFLELKKPILDKAAAQYKRYPNDNLSQEGLFKLIKNKKVTLLVKY